MLQRKYHFHFRKFNTFITLSAGFSTCKSYPELLETEPEMLYIYYIVKHTYIIHFGLFTYGCMFSLYINIKLDP